MRNSFSNSGVGTANGNSQSGQGPARIIITGRPLNADCHWWYFV